MVSIINSLTVVCEYERACELWKSVSGEPLEGDKLGGAFQFWNDRSNQRTEDAVLLFTKKYPDVFVLVESEYLDTGEAQVCGYMGGTRLFRR